MVDEKKISMTPAVEISYLKPEEQQMLLTAIDKYFPRSYAPFQIENTIFKLLDAWQKKRQRDQSR